MAFALVATSEGIFSVEEDGSTARLSADPVSGMCAAGSTVVTVASDWSLGRVVDDAASWSTLEVADAETPTCLLPLDDGRLVIGTVGAHLAVVDGAAVAWLSSFDEIPGRDGWTQPWGAPADARSMTSLPATSAGARDAIFVNAHVGGVVRSDDGGSTWRQLLDPHIDVHQVRGHGTDLLLTATGAAGFGLSRDRGDTWTHTSSGMRRGYCRAVAVSGAHVLVTASGGPYSEDGAVYRRALDDDAPFSVVEGGLPKSFGGNVDTDLLDGDEAGRAVVASPDGTVYASGDEGASWRTLATVPGRPNAVVLR